MDYFAIFFLQSINKFLDFFHETDGQISYFTTKSTKDVPNFFTTDRRIFQFFFIQSICARGKLTYMKIYAECRVIFKGTAKFRNIFQIDFRILSFHNVADWINSRFFFKSDWKILLFYQPSTDEFRDFLKHCKC